MVKKAKNQVITLIFTLIYLSTMTLVGAFGAFNVLKVPEMNPQYADLRLITSSSECSLNSGWSITGPTCDPWDRLYNYPSLWVEIFGLFGFTQKQTVIIGTMEIALLTLLVGFWLYSGQKINQTQSSRFFLNILVIIFAISPPILLLMERGNIDTLMFAGITFAVVLKNRGYNKISMCTLIFLGALKIYPLAGLIFFINTKNSMRRIIVFVSLSLLSLYSLAGDLKYILERSETTWNTVSYGVSIVPLGAFQFLGADQSKKIALLCGYVILISLTIILRIRCAKIIHRTRTSLELNITVWNSFGIFSVVFIATFLMGTSFDYRMILLLPIFVSLAASVVSGKERFVILCCMLISMFGGHYIPAIGALGVAINYFSDVSMLVGSAFLINLIVPRSKKRIYTNDISNV
jgi:hypothetical protein